MPTATTRQAVSRIGQMGRSMSQPPPASRSSTTGGFSSHRRHQSSSPAPSSRVTLHIKEVKIPPVFDIFDAPVHLQRERTVSPARRQPLPRTPPFAAMPTSPLSEPRPRPRAASPLPKHIVVEVFDGPSCRPPSSVLMDSREGLRQGRSPAVTRLSHTSSQSTSPSSPDHNKVGNTAAQPQLFIFDGPSRPHKHRKPTNDPPKVRALIAGTLAVGAVASAGLVISTQ
ncbi:hypothetical protein CC1G_06953 [Coprinopsis cinerea okayama7|uniref:Uncharacterized protein n=1 Tax=Coprinopsis cinerea (strain Okayama-7 / 130 / ATCC MYA-4618 / FGSC 9003) TaxID=240176 RepID=A8NZT9_COPC7|nr:hypothetical protein CC1G_06953 [Coprinopsis cinerea okayama7\|eukprot:XP_001837747.2 hypothetical protein CC1G_06953 [Coprinopsis cinerea okayama7\